MAYSSVITYPVYDLNSTEFLEVVRELLQVEMLNQRTAHGKIFLPLVVKPDEYLLDKVADKEIAPSYCAISKAKMESSDPNFPSQQNNMNFYIISILAFGLGNLRKIADSIYVILNDLDVKTYLSQVESARGDRLVYNKNSLHISSLSTEIEEKKTLNSKNVIYGNLIFQAQITEKTQLNTSTPIHSVVVTNKIGEDEKEIIQTKTY
jgi:hypothetical protein